MLPAACTGGTIPNRDLPYAFEANNTSLCGISWPNSVEPLHNLTSCCDGPVLVGNDCFQFCKTEKTGSQFSSCVQKHVIGGSEQPFSTQCNMPRAVGRAGEGKKNAGWWGLGVVLMFGLAWMA